LNPHIHCLLQTVVNKVVIIGAGGFIGSALVKALIGYQVVTLPGRNFLSISMEEIAAALRGSRIVINLAGHPIFGRWTPRNKRQIADSRIMLSGKLAEVINTCDSPPSLLINASAIGIYNEHGVHTENSLGFSGGFLGNVVEKWEKAALAAKSDKTNVALVRIGIVLGKQGGSYKIVRKLIKFGMGSWFGKGNQGFSFIWIEDLVRAVRFICDANLGGVINLTAPEPTTYKVFIKTAAARCKVKILWPIPYFVVKLLFGEASVLFTTGQKVFPEILTANGFMFAAPDIHSCIGKIEAT
jgi:uncharacterized protein (TIGR01777 family)